MTLFKTEYSGTCPFCLCHPTGHSRTHSGLADKMHAFLLHSVKDNICKVLVTTALKTHCLLSELL